VPVEEGYLEAAAKAVKSDLTDEFVPPRVSYVMDGSTRNDRAHEEAAGIEFSSLDGVMQGLDHPTRTPKAGSNRVARHRRTKIRSSRQQPRRG